MSDLATLTRKALDDVAASTTLAALDEVRVRWLGKKGVLTEQLKSLGSLPAADRPAAGARINEAKAQVQAAIDSAQGQLESAAIEAELSAGRIDVTLSGRGEARGSVHPVTRARLRIEQIFRRSGLKRSTSPLITQRARCTTRSIFRTDGCCEHIRRRFKFASSRKGGCRSR